MIARLSHCLSVVVGLAAAMIVAAPAFANVIVFQDAFESPRVPAGNYNNYNPGQHFGPWTAVGAGPSSIVSGAFVQSGIHFLALEGVSGQWADLAGQTSNGTEGFQTSLATVIGRRYEVAFWVGNVIDPSYPGGFFGNSTTVKLVLNNADVFHAANLGGNTQNQTWQQFRYEFVATNNLTTVGFINGDPSTDYSSGLDGVVISEVSAVPEPSTWAMLMMGFAGIGFLSVRRARKASALAAH